MNMSLIEQIVAYLESLPTIPGVKYGYAMTIMECCWIDICLSWQKRK